MYLTINLVNNEANLTNRLGMILPTATHELAIQ